MLIGFLITFAVTRAITRRIHARAGTQPGEPGQPGEQPGPAGQGSPADRRNGAADQRSGLADIYIGGVHIHHQVFGILLVLATGLVEFRYNPRSPWEEVLAGLFGAGAALTLDEFALWFHLDDVYWTKSGRQSIDAILVGGALGAVLLLQPSLVGTAASRNPAAIAGYLAGVCVILALAGVCIFKGKIATGLIGIVLPPLAMVGAVRLAKPSSVWARRRYRPGRLSRAQRRFGPAYQRRHDRLRDLLGGRPDGPGDEPDPPAC
jgi:hypothetical protein